MSQAKDTRLLLIDGGGLAPYVSLLAQALSKYCEVTVFGQESKYLSSRIGFIERKSFRGSNRRRLPLLSFVHDYMVALWDVVRIGLAIGRIKPAVVHLQGHFPLLFLLAFGPMRGKLFWTIHDVELREAKYGLRGIIGVSILRVTNQSSMIGVASNAIIVHGEALKQQLSKRWWARGKTYSLPHGNYDGIYQPAQGITPTTPTALFFGKIRPYKGLELFIQSAAIIAKVFKQAKFVIAGSGNLSPYRPLLEKAGGNLFEIHNRFISDEEVPLLFGRASVVVLPYTEASQSGVLALAYTLGVPVVASRTGSIPEILDHGETGFLFEPGNVKEMSDYVLLLLQDKSLRDKMARNARLKASTMLSWESIAEKTLQLYQVSGSIKV